MKRYIKGIRKPFNLKGKLRFAFILFVAVLLLVVFRTFFFAQVEVMSPRPDLGLMAGDHVVVNRLCYGIRMPMFQQFGYRRWGNCSPEIGEIVVFDYPDASGRIGIDRVIGLPGDTLWMEEDSTAFVVVPSGSFGVGQLLLSEKWIVGKPACISYSLDRNRPLHRIFRSKRFFKDIK